MTTSDDLLSTISYHIEETRRMITETGKSRSAVKRDGALTRLYFKITAIGLSEKKRRTRKYRLGFPLSQLPAVDPLRRPYGESRGYTGEIGLALSVVMGRRECGEYLELKFCECLRTNRRLFRSSRVGRR
jgi:hypothetical protein